ncbi:hypothetical protein D3C73_1315410 [compost metagenome]
MTAVSLTVKVALTVASLAVSTPLTVASFAVSVPLTAVSVTVNLPETAALPFTSSLADGAAVPIPRLPEAIFSTPVRSVSS